MHKSFPHYCVVSLCLNSSGTNFALRAHCGHTAGTCIKDHPEEMEGGNIKQHKRMQQHNGTI